MERRRELGTNEQDEIYLEELNLSPTRRGRQANGKPSKPYYNTIYTSS
jgi:hypothetical protein